MPNQTNPSEVKSTKRAFNRLLPTLILALSIWILYTQLHVSKWHILVFGAFFIALYQSLASLSNPEGTRKYWIVSIISYALFGPITLVALILLSAILR
jgi:hypothetical protein